MTDLKRRAMLGALGTAIAAGMATSACGRAEPDASDATTRMESGPTAKVIDIHTHMYSERWAAVLRDAQDPNVKLVAGPNGEQMFYRWSGIGGLSPLMFDWDARIRAMDAAGVDVAIISLSAPNVHWGTRATSTRAARRINEDFAAARRAHPERIHWMASLPWDHPDDALAELRRAKETGAVGVCMLTNILGQPLTHERYLRIWAEIEAMELPVFIHPTLPFDDGMGLAGHGELGNAVGFTTETSLCFARLIIDGHLDRFPRLKLIASHGGGALPYLAARLDQCWEKIGRDRRIDAPPSSYFSRLYFDSILYDQKTLNFLVDYVGAERVLYGSDYPFSIGDMSGMLSRVDALPAAERDLVRSGNAYRIFDLDAT